MQGLTAKGDGPNGCGGQLGWRSGGWVGGSFQLWNEYQLFKSSNNIILSNEAMDLQHQICTKWMPGQRDQNAL